MITIAAYNKLGSYIVLISLCLPAILHIRSYSMGGDSDTFEFFIWMFGFGIGGFPNENYWFFGSIWIGYGWLILIAVLGLIFSVLIIVFSFLCIKKEPGETKKYGILSLVFAVIFYIISAAFFGMGMGINYTIPLSLFGIVIGSILIIIAK